MDMDEGRYFRQLASRCYELGRACFDLDISLQLNEIGDELLLTARKSDGQDNRTVTMSQCSRSRGKLNFHDY